MNEEQTLKLERIASALESINDSLKQVAIQIERANNKSDVKEMSKSSDDVFAKRQRKEPHFAKQILEVVPGYSGALVKVDKRKSDGKEFASIQTKSAEYGYCTLFIKRDKVGDKWEEVLKRFDNNGVKLYVDAYFFWRVSNGTIKSRWTASFMKFADIKDAPFQQKQNNGLVATANLASESEAIPEDGVSSDNDVVGGSDEVPF